MWRGRTALERFTRGVRAVAVAAYVALAVPAFAEDYVVKAGDTCVSIAARELGDRAAYQEIHRLNPSLGPLPHKLKPGTVLRLPTPGLTPADATLTRSRGAVQVKRPSESDWDPAQRGMDLFRAWRVGARERSAAELTFRDQSQLTMRENTVVVIYGGAAARSRVMGGRAELERGALESRLAELRGKPMVVTTPSAEATLGAGRSLIDVDDKAASRVANHGGTEISVRAVDRSKRPRGKKVAVADGMGSRVDLGKPPAPPRPLPPAPSWQAQAILGAALTGATGSIRAEWSPVAEAVRYRVAVYAGSAASPGDLVTAVSAAANATAIEVHQLPPGNYHAVVATIDSEGFESKPSGALPADVIAIAAPQSTGLGPDSANANGVHDHAASPPTMPMGTALTAPDGVACTISPADAPLANHTDLVIRSPDEYLLTCRRGESRATPLVVVGRDLAVSLVGPQRAKVDKPAPITLRSAEESAADLIDVRVAGGRIATSTKTSGGIDLVTVPDPGTTTLSLTVVLRAATNVVVGRLEVPVDAPPAPTPSPAPVPAPTVSFELGGYLGYHTFPAGSSGVAELGNTPDRRLAVTSGPELGGRAAVWLGRRAGLEAELGAIPTGYAGIDGAAIVAATRGHGAVSILRDGRFELRGHLGVGALALLGRRLTSERDIDAHLDYGLALLIQAGSNMKFRIDGRHAIGPALDGGYADMFMLQLGVTKRR